jgi:diacylglycerol kinase (ATP)
VLTVRNKFLGQGEYGYHPIRKIKVCLSGLRYAIRYDFSVAYKIYLSLFMLLVCFFSDNGSIYFSLWPPPAS